MLSVTNPSDERLTSARRAKLAYIYVRQSTVTQIKHHQESTELQYRLVDRAEVSAGRASGSRSSTRISANPAPARPTARASRS